MDKLLVILKLALEYWTEHRELDDDLPLSIKTALLNLSEAFPVTAVDKWSGGIPCVNNSCSCLPHECLMPNHFDARVVKAPRRVVDLTDAELEKLWEGGETDYVKRNRPEWVAVRYPWRLFDTNPSVVLEHNPEWYKKKVKGRESRSIAAVVPESVLKLLDKE